jgi:hypothetical protein
MYILGRKLATITINPAWILFFIAAAVLVAYGMVSVWVVLLIMLNDFRINIIIPLDTQEES